MASPKIVMIASVIPVGPRARALSEQYFALQILTALDAIPPGPPPDDAALRGLLLPSEWSWEKTLVVRALNSAGLPGTFSAKVDKTPRPPAATEEALTAIKKEWLAFDRYDLRWNEQSSPTKALAGPANALRLSQGLAFLATMPGDIPQQLGLVHYFHIDKVIDSTFGIDEICHFVAAPQFKSGTPVPDLTFTPGARSTEPVLQGHDAVRWDYVSAVGTPPLVMFMQPVSVERDPARHRPIRFDKEQPASDPPGLNLEDYWLRSRDPGGDWAADLLERFAEALDVPARLLGASRYARTRRLKKVVDPRDPPRPLELELEQRLLLQAVAYSASWTKSEAAKALEAMADLTHMGSFALSPRDKTTLSRKLDAFKDTVSNEVQARPRWEEILRKALGEAAPTGASAIELLDARIASDPRLAERALYLVWRALALEEDGQPKAPPLRLWWVQVEANTTASETLRRLLTRGVGASLPPIAERSFAVEAVGALKTALSACVVRPAALTELQSRWQAALVSAKADTRWPLLLSDEVCPSAFWSEYIGLFGEQIFDDLPAAGKARRPSAKPRGITIQIDHVHHDEDPIPGARPAWQNVAGVGVAIRDAAKARPCWRPINAALLCDRDGRALLKAPCLLPLRIPFRDGLRFPFLTFNQRSLVAESPLADGTHGVLKLDGMGATDGVGASPMRSLYRHLPVVARTSAERDELDRLLLPRLVYGRTYLLAAFAMDAAGGLPDELTGRGDVPSAEARPWKMIPDWNVPEDKPGVVVSVTYLRDTGIGQVRMVALSRDGAPADWPPIPPDVYPLVAELAPEATPEQQADAPLARDASLVLLHQGHSSQIIGVKPPTADIDVLDQWSESKEHVQSLWTEHRRWLRERQKDGTIERDRNDILFEDPAVTHLAVRIERWAFVNGGGTWTSDGQQAWVLLELRPQDRERKRWIEIVVQLAGEPEDAWTTPWKMDEARDRPLTIEVPRNKGGTLVGRVSVHALVPKTFAPRFDPDVLKPADREQPRFNLIDDEATALASTEIKQRFFVLKPRIFHVEAATDAFPSEAELYESLRVRSDSVRRHVNVSLTFLAEQAGRMRNMVRCDLLRQPWRWQGRPLDPWPGTRWGAPNDVSKWELGAFAGLDELFDTDVLRIGHVPLLRTNAPLDRGHLYTDDWAPRPGLARYIRYALRAYSRYAGLFARRLEPTTTRSNRTPSIGWKSVFLRYVGATPQRPIVRAIVPLTEPAGEASGHSALPPLLVVLDEVAFEQCGISEGLECEVMSEEPTQPASDGSPRKNVLQYGRDPIVDRPIGNGTTVPLPDSLSLSVEGPFGYTFDTDARQPRFGASSYLVSPPADPRVRAWDFLKVRFRRLAERRTAAQPSMIHEHPADHPSLANWTSPTWVQFTPSNHFGVPWKNVKALPIQDDIQLVVQTAEDDVRRDTSQFIYFALVTASVRDFRGEIGQERYVEDAFAPAIPGKKGGGVLFSFASRGQHTLAMWVRIVEVQVAFNAVVPQTSREFWAQLLDAEDGHEPRDAGYRITRISPRTPLHDVPR